MKKIIRNLILIILILLITVFLIFLISGYSIYKKAIKEIPLDKKIEEIKSQENYCRLDEMPSYYIDAVIAAEDIRYREHGAIDLISIGRAIWTNIKNFKPIEGGSTITQQLAKNSYFSQKKELTRKFAEIFMAMDYEKNCSKDEILELYLNTCFFGDNCYSVKEASQHYFNKEPIEMTLYEATMLAGIPNAPSKYSPIKHLELAQKRHKQVLRKMVECNYLTQEQADELIEEGENYQWNVGM